MNKAQDFRKWLYDTAFNYDTIMRDAERKMKNTLNKYIVELQGGLGSSDGFIAFNDETGFPQFRDFNDEFWHTIFGVRVKATKEDDYEYHYELYIYTDDNSAEEMDNNLDGTWSNGWFNPYNYGELSIFELLEYCREYEKLMLNN